MVVGAISCRIWPRLTTNPDEDNPEAVEEALDDRRCLYIIILSVLPAYRRFGIASMLLEEAIKRSTTDLPHLYSVYLHTPIGNKMAISFYVKAGFVKGEVIKDYYQSMENTDDKDGYLIEKVFETQETS